MKTTTLVSCLTGGLLAAACGSEAPPHEPPENADLEGDPVVIVTADAVATAAAALTTTGAGGATGGATAAGSTTTSGRAESTVSSSGAGSSPPEVSSSTESGGSAGAPSGQAGLGGSPDVGSEGPSTSTSTGVTGGAGQPATTGEPLPPAPIPIGAVRITEYVEGSSNDKAVELSNLSTKPVSLLACRLEIYFNDNPELGLAIELAVELGPGASHVLCHTRASAELLAVCDQPTTQLSFNGNDTLVLRCDDAVHDSFGQVGFDGTAWRSSAPSSGDPWTGAFSSIDHVLRRRCDAAPRTDPAPPFEPALTADWFPVWSFVAPPNSGAAYEGLGDPACAAPDPGAGGAPGLD